MNEKKTSIIVISVIAALFLFSAGRTFYYQTKYRNALSELGQLRSELEYIDNRKRELEEQSLRTSNIIREAAEYIDRSDEILKQSGTTVREIRKQVEDLESYCNKLELYIIDINNNINH